LRLGSSFNQIGDRKIIDKFGPEGVPKLVFKASEYLKKLQTGYLPHYVFIAIFGVVLILTSCIAIRIFPKVASEFLFAVGHL
jgi:NADH-quinone oxidoreductase subunit L